MEKVAAEEYPIPPDVHVPPGVVVDPRVRRLLALPRHEQRSNEWYRARHERLTASDVATVLGQNPYETVESFILKKLGIGPKFEGNFATRHGAAHEDIARDMYCERYNEYSFELGLIGHESIPWLGGSPDGVTASGKLIEIKCPIRREIKDEVPGHYAAQVQVCLEVLNLEEAVFIQYKPGGLLWTEEFVVTRVVRDRDWFRTHLPTMERVWNQVLFYRTHGCAELLAKIEARKRPRKITNAPKLTLPPPPAECMIVDELYSSFLEANVEDAETHEDMPVCLIVEDGDTN